MNRYQAVVISEGIAYGKAFFLNSNIKVNDSKCLDSLAEIEFFKKCLDKAYEDLSRLETLMDNKDEDFITVHKMILHDPTLLSEVSDLIKKYHYNAGYAFDLVINRYIKQFEDLNSTYLSERNVDFKDVRKRVLLHLLNDLEDNKEDDKIILVCDELYPSYLMEYKDHLAGIVALKGGTTSHGAILAKAREIPFVLCDSLDKLSGNIIIDTRSKEIISDASSDLILSYKELKDQISKKIRIYDFQDFGIRLLANVSSNDELYKVRKYKMYGVGLYRTEFIFMNKNRALTMDEQYLIYSEAVGLLKQRPITFRTFDIGDDKKLSYIETYKKGILNYKNNPSLFEDQIKALIKANKYQNMKIMFPMIESYSEFSYLRDWVLNIKKKMQNDSYLKIGMMLETKEALKNLDDFKDVDFISLGTNDLTHELYHIDRDKILDYNSFISDLILKLEEVSKHCKKYNIELSICGELAGIKDVVSKLYQIGIKNYSVSVGLAKTLEMSLKEILKIE